ncbi:MAG: ribbon-helix-helix domain-containing protein [Deltaproteobacteria bacterium]|nr:ribbon-helix-helix domain-containing protein [Deltaproteobacteria bacterium]
MDRMRLTSLVFRIPKPRLEQLKDLSRRTRVRQSEYLREAIADLLAKYDPEAI